jgi:HD superfamily phosphohydrolase
MTNKKKIINDPLYGFLTIPYGWLFDLIEHPYFQRLRRIKQLGMSHLVYPGALHTRFHHALGALKLTLEAIENLRFKDVEITEEEAEATCAAILLHDIGHGPFSHALEQAIVKGVHHEEISLLFMQRLNEEFNGKLTLAIEVFKGTYHKKFLHQLVSSQLDMDRMDYLMRDSFYTGVSEGVIGADRIIKMLNVANGSLVVEEKGIYSIEKFLVARRLMYWQVYLHKTVVAAEMQLLLLLKRAKELVLNGEQLFTTPAFNHFLSQNISNENFSTDKNNLEQYALLDDFDITASVKVWMQHSDETLAYLSKSLINRKLSKIIFQNTAFSEQDINKVKEEVKQRKKITDNEINYYVFSGSVHNNAYSDTQVSINILQKNGAVNDVGKVSDNYSISSMSRDVEKFYLCYPK